jgi:hypothetical protein
MIDIHGPVIEHRFDHLNNDETRWRLEQAIDRTQERERVHGIPFSRRSVNERLREGEHRDFMHQHY